MSVGRFASLAATVVVVGIQFSVVHSYILPSGNWTTDYATAVTPDSPTYDRCKTTHRCNRAFATYVVDEGRYLFRKQRFKDGQQENADLFLNFEDWKAGTLGLGVDHVSCHCNRHVDTAVSFFHRMLPGYVTGTQAYLHGQLQVTKGAHFNAFDPIYDIPGPDEFSWDLVFNSSEISIMFNTSGVAPTLTIENTTCIDLGLCNSSLVLEGFVGMTEGGTETGLFNFHSIYLGPSVNVTVTGNRALVLISRSTAIFDTDIAVQPGTLGVCGVYPSSVVFLWLTCVLH
jgi:hypothetical protein